MWTGIREIPVGEYKRDRILFPDFAKNAIF
jgi:hypothetical protein